MIKKKTVKKLGRQVVALALVTSVTFTGLSLDTMAQSIKTRKETAKEVQAQNKIKNKKSEPTVVKELEDLKTANASTYLLSDGSRKLEIYSTDLRYEEDGKLIDYDPVLKKVEKNDIKQLKEIAQDSHTVKENDIKDYNYVNIAGDAKQYFPNELGEDKTILMQKGEYTIAFSPILNNESEIEVREETQQENIESAQNNKTEDEAKELTEKDGTEQSDKASVLTGEMNGTKITYTDEKENIEYKYTSLSQGIKEDIILNEKPQTNEFTFKISLEGIKAKINEDNKEIDLIDKKTKEKIAYIPAPNILDGDGNLSYEDVSYELVGDILKIVVSEEYFENKDLKYPVTIDPYVLWHHWGLESATVTDFPYSTSVNMKHTGPFFQLQNKCNKYSPYSTSEYYCYIDTSGIEKNNTITGTSETLYDSYIEEASLCMIEYETNSTSVPIGPQTLTAGTVEVRNIEGAWNPDTITWNNHPEMSEKVWNEFQATGARLTVHLLDITDWVQAVVSKEIPNYGLALKAKEPGTGDTFYTSQGGMGYDNNGIYRSQYMSFSITYRDTEKYDASLSMSAEYDSESNKINLSIPDIGNDEISVTQYKVFKRLPSENNFKCISVCDSPEEMVSLNTSDITDTADFRISAAYTDGTAKLSNIITLKKKTETINGQAKTTYEQTTVDTDADGLEDGYEIWDFKTKWKDKDANGNYVTDSDGDGFPDGYEVFMLGTDPAVVTPKNGNQDNDGLTDWEEYLRGTDPHLKDSDFDNKIDGTDSTPRWTDGGTNEMTAYSAEVYVGPYNRTYTETKDGVTYTYIQSIYSGEIRSIKADYGNELLNTENKYFYDEKYNLTAIVEVYHQKNSNGTTEKRAVCKTYSYDNQGNLAYICDQKTKYTMDYDSNGEMTNLYVGGQRLINHAQTNLENHEDSNGNTDHLSTGALIRKDKSITTYGNGNQETNITILYKVPEASEDESSQNSTTNLTAAKMETSYNNSSQNSYISEYNNDGNLLKLSDYTLNASNPLISTFSYTDNGMSMVRNDGFAKMLATTEDETNNTSTTDISYTFKDVKGDSITYNTTDMTGATAKGDTDNKVNAKKFYNGDVAEYTYDGESDITTDKLYSDLYKKYIISCKQTKNEQTNAITYDIDNLTGDKTIDYTHDLRGNITQVKINGALACKYEYDGHGRLINEKDYRGEKEYLYLYNESGNMQTKKIYSFIDGQRGAIAESDKSYTYGNGNWPDQLTKYNGQTITYDAGNNGGNPLTYRDGMSFTWERGRSLQKINFSNGTQVTYRYNENGLRTYKDTQSETVVYEWDGNTLLRETITYKAQNKTYDIWYYYDTMGNITGFEYSYLNDLDEKVKTRIYYEKDLQGNVIGLMDSRGAELATYSYDAWGNITSKICYEGYEMIESLNHIGYRGYYRDNESGFYYLQSRYYDAQTGRFINADDVSVFDIEGSSMFKDNLYIYCNGDPVNDTDPTGYWPKVKASIKSGKIRIEFKASLSDLATYFATKALIDGIGSSVTSAIPGANILTVPLAIRAGLEGYCAYLLDKYGEGKKVTIWVELSYGMRWEKRKITMMKIPYYVPIVYIKSFKVGGGVA